MNFAKFLRTPFLWNTIGSYFEALFIVWLQTLQVIYLQLDALDYTTVFCSNPTNFWFLHQMQFSFLVSRCNDDFCDTGLEVLSLEIPAKRAACSFKSPDSRCLSTVPGSCRRFGCAFNSFGFAPLLIILLNWVSHVSVCQNGSTTSIAPLPWLILAKIFIILLKGKKCNFNSQY